MAGGAAWQANQPSLQVSNTQAQSLGETSLRAANVFAPGQVTYKDPFTGKLGPRPAEVPPLVLNPEQMRAFSTSGEGLNPVQSPVDKRAILLPLQGRFHHGMVVQLEEENRIHAHCATQLASSNKPTPAAR